MECGLVCLGWRVEAAHLAHELQRSCLDLIIGRRRVKVEERPDVSAQGCYLSISDSGRTSIGPPRAGGIVVASWMA
jgi:hypothetical protein